jgi:hypothetical protein
LEEHTASILRVGDYTKQEISGKQVEVRVLLVALAFCLTNCVRTQKIVVVDAVRTSN